MQRLQGATCGFARGALALVLCAALVLLSLGVLPQRAFGYFDRGAVEVTLGANALELEAGGTASVTVQISPESDEQTEGCGMPSCPQGCSEGCLDENGQCQCAGSDYTTYYATAAASSSDSSVAIARYDAGTLTVYARSAGEATITLTASLRQFTDGVASIAVTVTGEGDSSSASASSDVETPDEAEPEQEDKADVVEKDVMGSTMRYVRIGDSLDAASELADFAGTEGDITFWFGDTYYHPDYSLTATGTDYSAEDVGELDVELDVGTQASGALAKVLEGLDGYLLVEFAQEGALPTGMLVYALADGVLEDGAEVALYSYDEQTTSFVAEDAEVSITGGYAVFKAEEGKVYAVSTRDLTTEANDIVVLGESSGTTAGADGQSADGVAPMVYAAAAIVVLALLIVAGVCIALRKAGKKGEDDEGGEGTDEGCVDALS